MPKKNKNVKPYKPNTTKANMRWNKKELDRRLSAFAKSVANNEEFQHEGYGYYLSDGVSVRPETYAIMMGLVEYPSDCSCCECDVCKFYFELE